MEPRISDGEADRPRSALGKQTGRVIVIGPYLRTRRAGPDAREDPHVIRGSEARLEEAVGLARAIDLVIESDLNILDIAPLVVIVREAGGVFTDLEGREVGLATTSALAGPAALHALALRAFDRA